jgi:plasmid stabilization system protein ParE
MNWAVIWQPTAEDQLAELWMAADDRAALADAADAIDALLRRDPLAQGESRHDNLRIFLHGPLVVDYEVDASRRLVRVLRVRRNPPL